MPTLPSGLPDIVEGEEDIARFLTQSSHYNAQMAKPSAFLPSPRDRETSVSRHGCEPTDQLWAIGLESAGERNLHGAAIFKAFVVQKAELQLLADEPPVRHAVIRGWPWLNSDPELQKAQQKEKAVVIASEALLLRK
jgi:hypothetical protein